MSKIKSFTIPKELVVKAYELVKANGGAAGVDQQSLADFDKNLKDNLYKIWNRMSSGVSKEALKSMRAETRKWNFRNRPDLELKDIANMYNPVLRGWIGYYGRYHPTALGSVLGHFNLTLRAWAMCKYKKLRGRKTKATQFLQGIAEREPRLFVHWRKDMALRFA